MSLTTKHRGFRLLLANILVITFMIAGSVPAFAETEGADATALVNAKETQYQWFYWPGWAFAALVVLVSGLVLFAWYKSVLGPKYRGRKVTQ